MRVRARARKKDNRARARKGHGRERDIGLTFPQKNFFGILLTTASGKLEKAIKEPLTIDH
jgi:hypothetical protein